jgi:hypothetical protein
MSDGLIEACKPCMRRNGCGKVACDEEDCICRRLCEDCATSIAKVVASVELLRAEQEELF